MSLALEEVWYALCAAWEASLSGGLVSMGLLFVGTTQRPVSGWRFPTSINSAVQNTLQSFLVKMT